MVCQLATTHYFTPQPTVSFCKYSLLENLTSSKNKTTTKISTTDDTLFASQCALAAAMPRGVLYLT